jgi:DHA2 family multidrug resistance protein
VLTPVAARIAGRIDARWLLSAGFLLMAWGLWLQVGVTTSTSGFWSFAVPLATVGAASALLFVPLSIAVLGNTTPSEGPKAAAMVNLGVQLGGSIAVALLDVVVDRRETMHSQILAAYQNIARQPIQQFLQHGGTLTQLSNIVRSQSAVLAFADATFVMALVALFCTPLVLMMRRPRPQQ